MRIPLITVHEWRSIAPLLPPTNDPGKTRHGDRLYVSAFYYAEATRSSLENLPAAFGNPRLLRTRRQRWERDGALGKLMEAGGPVIARMKAGYLNLIRDASIDRQTSSDFFGRDGIPQLPHMEPRGQYAARRRVPAG
jgi:transposase